MYIGGRLREFRRLRAFSTLSPEFAIISAIFQYSEHILATAEMSYRVRIIAEELA